MIEHTTDFKLIQELWKGHSYELGIPYESKIKEFIESNSVLIYKDKGIQGLCCYKIKDKYREIFIDIFLPIIKGKEHQILTEFIKGIIKDTQSLISVLNYHIAIEVRSDYYLNSLYKDLCYMYDTRISKSNKLKLNKYYLDLTKFK